MCQTRVLIVIVAVACLFVAWQGSPKAAAARAFDTPEAVFQAYHDATQKGDWQAAASCLTAESQAMMADALVMAASVSTAVDQKKEAGLTQLLRRHGVDQNARPAANRPLPAFSSAVRNKPALIQDVAAWLEKNGGGRGPDFRIEKISALQVKGNSATATADTARGQVPIEFHRVSSGWLISLPDKKSTSRSAQDNVEATGGQSADASQSKSSGTIWMGNKTHSLKHAIAYRTKFFDDPCTAVLMTAQPIRPRELQELKKVLQSKGSDEAFFVSGVTLRMLFDDAGALKYVFGWADNVSINRNSGVDAQVERHEGRIQGRAAMKEADTVFKDLKFRFEARFDVELMLVGDQGPIRADVSKEAAPPKQNSSPSSEPQAATESKTGLPASHDRIAVKDFPILKGGNSLTFDSAAQQIRFETGSEIDAIAKYYQQEMKSRGWEEGFQSVASFFANLRFKQDGRTISINAKRGVFGKIATVTISGDGLLWDGQDGPARVAAQHETRDAFDASDKIKPSEISQETAASATRDTIKSSDFQLLDAQSTSYSGSNEMIQFNSRKGVPENVEFHTGVLTAKGWRRTLSSELDGLHLLRFEKGNAYIRIGLWPHDFSDNTGQHKGAKGATEGTGLTWSHPGPYGNVPERMLRDYERTLGPLSPEGREKFKNAIRKKRELALTGGREVPAKAWDAANEPLSKGDGPASQRP